MTGAFGRMLNFGLSYIFGLGVWLFIVILLWLGYILMKSGIYGIRISTYIGLFLILLSFSGILHFFVVKFTFSEIVNTGRGGGAVGFLIGNAGISALGNWGTIVILLAILFIGVFLGFNTSFLAITEKAKALGIIKEKFLPDEDIDEEEDEDEEEEVEFEPDQEDEELEDSEDDGEDEELEDGEEDGEDEEEEIKKPRNFLNTTIITKINKLHI
jgi:hypothetical protein